MNLHIHTLYGCSPTPLAHYLKALGILRLVSEQKDHKVRGWWEGERFKLATCLSEQELLDFFLYEYAPTPIIAPWNAMSGFYDSKKNILDLFIDLQSAHRWRSLKHAIISARQTIVPVFKDTLHKAQKAKSLAHKNKGDKQLDQFAKQADSKRKALKETIIAECMRKWRGKQGEWLRVVAAEQGDEISDIKYTSLLGGAGGVNSKLEFTLNFLNSIGALFDILTGKPHIDTTNLLQLSVFATIIADRERRGNDNSGGQFIPSSVNAANGSTGFASNRWVNPWDFILAIEGTILFKSSVTRRIQGADKRLAVSPFCLRETFAGHEGNGNNEAVACEQWFPLWTTPLHKNEFITLMSEGRSSSLRSFAIAETPIDLVRSIARLGTTRGITSFQRYSYIQRNGTAHFATPLGRWHVTEQPHQNLIDQIAPWVARLRKAANSKNAPAIMERTCRVCEEAIMACCRDGTSAYRWQELLIALGQAEQCLVRSPHSTAKQNLRPLPSLDPAWLAAIAEDSSDLRLAMAMASACGCADNGMPDCRNPVRLHFLPLKTDKSGLIFDNNPHFSISGDSLTHDPSVVVGGTNLVNSACAIIRRRLITHVGNGFPLTGKYSVHLKDIGAFLVGAVDDRRIKALAWPLTALRWRNCARQAKEQVHPTTTAEGLLDLYGLLRITYVSGGRLKISGNEISIHCDPTIFHLLLAGQTGRAIKQACQRLTASGLRPHLSTAIANQQQTRRLAASLIFPLHDSDMPYLAARAHQTYSLYCEFV